MKKCSSSSGSGSGSSSSNSSAGGGRSGNKSSSIKSNIYTKLIVVVTALEIVTAVIPLV